jgi:class 3 adenylate cyclase/tetratricopeptide (TPR) repeat protein
MAAETITVLFTDLVGSTDLLSRVGEAQADKLRREHFGLLRKAIEQHGGREVKSLGDGLMVVFGGVASALDAAVAMQQAITARPSDAEPLSIKIGVAVGDAEVEDEDDDYFGLPVVEAARLCAKAQGGEILTTEFVRMLARSRSKVELEPVGTLELKGLDEPVETFRVRWVPIDPSERRPPLPSRLASSVSATFVGREAEVEQLTAAWKAITAHGERRAMLVAGEPGIGKTTLSARFACDRYEDGAAVVYGRCDEDLGIPYQPWIEALTQLVRHVPESVLTAHVADRGSHLARVVPELAGRVSVEIPARGDVDTERFVLFGCVVDLLVRASGEYPVLVVLDDLHWADRGSVQLLRHVAGSDETMRVGILGTFRDSDITTDHPLTDFLAALHRENRGVRIPLRGFDDADLLHLLETVAGHEMDDQGVALRDALLAETAGNPFFVAEILRHLAETGAIYQHDGRWVADADLRAVGLPVSVREVVGRRLAALGPDTERILGLGAVIGRDFDLRLLTAVAQTDEDTLIDLCDAAVEAAVLQATDDPDRYTFAHALIEHTLYDGLSPARRARAHKAVAEQLEAIDPGRVGELASHWAQAVQASDVAKAIEYASRAGRQALDQLAPDEAVRWYGQALDLLDRAPTHDQHQRAEILVGLGDAQRQTGVAAHRETLLEAAHIADELDDVDLLVRAALANHRGIFSTVGEADFERIAVIDRALERLGDVNTPDRARLLALAANERTWVSDLDERLALSEKAIAVARATGDPAALAYTNTLAFLAMGAPETFARRSALITEAAEITDSLGDGAPRFSAHNEAAVSAIARADGAALARHTAAREEEAERVPHATIRWIQMYTRAVQTIIYGDLAEAERLAKDAFAFGNDTGHTDAMAFFLAQLVNIRLHQGRFDEVLTIVEQAVADAPGLPVYQAVLTNVYACAQRTDDARRLLDTDHENGFAMRADDNWTTAFANWADAAHRINATSVAMTLREVMAPYHDRIVTTNITVQPSIAHHLGLLDHTLGRLDNADRWFTEAMALHERLQSPLFITYTRAAWARTLVERGRGDDHTRARSMAEQALADAIAGGYGYIERDARGVLEQLG